MTTQWPLAWEGDRPQREIIQNGMQFSLNNAHISVMYHYVEDPRPNRAGMHPCPIAEFERQIIFLKERYRLTTIPDVYEGARGGSGERLCALTFDDGTRDHLVSVAPILKRHGVPGTFFIITGTLDGMVPAAHKIHILLSRAQPAALIEAFQEFLAAFFPDEVHERRIPVDRYLNDKRRHEDVLTANFKETLIALQGDAQEERFLSWMFKKLGLDEETLCREFFMNENEVQLLADGGNSVGSHGESHRAYDRANEETVRRDVRASRERFARAGITVAPVFSYPYGRISPDRHDVFQTLTGEGFSYAVTNERIAIGPSCDALRIPRYNTIDIRDFLHASA